MKKTVLLLMMLQLGTASLKAQNFKFGKVSKQELKEQFNPQDTAANATVLYRKQHISFNFMEKYGYVLSSDKDRGFVQENIVHERIKIYTKEGVAQANRIINLYDESNAFKEKIIGLKAITYNLDGNKIIETKLNKNGVFEEKSNDYWRKVKFTFPNVKVGSIIEYQYSIESRSLNISDIYFQQMIPIKKLTLNLLRQNFLDTGSIII